MEKIYEGSRIVNNIIGYKGDRIVGIYSGVLSVAEKLGVKYEEAITLIAENIKIDGVVYKPSSWYQVTFAQIKIADDYGRGNMDAIVAEEKPRSTVTQTGAFDFDYVMHELKMKAESDTMLDKMILEDALNKCPSHIIKESTKPEHAKKDDIKDNKVMMQLLPPLAQERIAEVFTFGARKYDGWNWSKGMEYSRLYGALNRHMGAWYKGEDLDLETGKSHLAHAGCCLMMLLEMAELKPEMDDRPKFYK